MKNPPVAVKTTIFALATLLAGGVSPQDWTTARKLTINDKDLMSRMMSFDKNNVSDNTIRALQSYTSDDEFEPQQVMKKSKAAAAICAWVCAIERYHYLI